MDALINQGQFTPNIRIILKAQITFKVPGPVDLQQRLVESNDHDNDIFTTTGSENIHVHTDSTNYNINHVSNNNTSDDTKEQHQSMNFIINPPPNSNTDNTVINAEYLLRSFMQWLSVNQNKLNYQYSVHQLFTGQYVMMVIKLIRTSVCLST
jgi:hypothetical protein